MNQNVEAGFIQVLKRVNFFNIFSFCICFYLYSKLCNFNKKWLLRWVTSTFTVLWATTSFTIFVMTIYFAGTVGLEPTTWRLTVVCTDQLCYIPIYLIFRRKKTKNRKFKVTTQWFLLCPNVLTRFTYFYTSVPPFKGEPQITSKAIISLFICSHI